MFRFLLIASTLVFSAVAAERTIEFSKMKLGEPPAGFRSALTGSGRPGEWKIIETEVPSSIPSLSPNAPVPKQNVLAQLSRDPTDNRYPLLIFEGEEFGDFTLTTRFKLHAGVVEQMAGIAFRIQNESNYFYIRASGLYNTLRFIPVVNGQLGAPVGNEIPIEKGVFHQLKIECKGNQIRCWLNDREAFPTLTDSTFGAGKIGFWTKSDSVSYFTDTKIVYTPRELLSAILVREAKQKYSRLVGVRIVAKKSDGTFAVVAATRPEQVGQPANEFEIKAINTDQRFVGRNKEEDYMIATLPLHDKNGDTIAAVRFEMDPFPGQAEKNVLARALPMLQEMELRVSMNKELNVMQ